MSKQPHGSVREPRTRRSKMAPPPTPLRPMTKPSKRHPGRRPRCQRWRLVNGRVWQCSKAARDGFRVCGVHGAGYPKREREGRAKNPALAALQTGTYATPQTLKRLWDSRPELRELFDLERNSENLFDFGDALAMGKALLRYFVEQAKLEDTDNSGGRTPPALAAIDRLQKLLEMGDRLLKIEEQLGPITHEELKRYTHGVASTLIRFVPAEQQEAAFEYLRSLAVRGDGEYGDPAADQPRSGPAGRCINTTSAAGGGA